MAGINEMYDYWDEIFEHASKWLDSKGIWDSSTSAVVKNLRIAMNKFNTDGYSFNDRDLLNTYDRKVFKGNNRRKQVIMNMGENKYPNIARGDNFVYGGEYFVFDRIKELDGSYVFKDMKGRDFEVAGGPSSDFNKIDNMIDIDIMDEYTNAMYDLYAGRQYYNELLETQGQEAADEFFQEVVNPLSEQVKNARMKLDAGLNRKHSSSNYTENVRNLIDWERETRGQMVTQGRWKKNASNTSTSSSDIPDVNLDDLINLQNDVEQFFNNNVNPPGPEPETIGRQRRRGNVEHRTHTAPSSPQPTTPQRGDQFYDPKRKRQYVYEGPDEVFEGMHSFISDQGRTFVGSFDDLEKFTDESRFLNIDDLSEYRSAIDDLDTFLGDIRHGSKSMEDGFWDRAQKAVKRVNKAEGKVKKKIKHHRMETDSYKKKKVLQGYINDWKNKHTQQSTPQPENTQRANTSEIDAPLEEEWSSGYDGADDAPFGVEDFDDEFLANLTDEQIFKQAQNEEQLKFFEKARNEARRRLGLEEISFNMDTGNNTINNNFNGVNQERQQQQRNTQSNQEYKIDTDKPWTWTDDDIRIMADGDPDAAIDLINQREQTRQQQQRQTQEQTKNIAEETKGNIDEETLKKRKIERQQRSDRIKYANKKLKGKTGQQLTKGSKKAIKARGMKGKKFKVKTKIKGGNFKQLIANTLVSKATQSVEKEVFRMHPDLFESLDDFADMTDDDIRYFADQIFDPDEKQSLKKQKVKEWMDKREQAREARGEAKQQRVVDEFDEYLDDFDANYKQNFYGNNTQGPSPNDFEFDANGEYNPHGGYYGNNDYKKPESYTMNEVEFEVDENGNTKINKTGKTKEVEIEQNKRNRTRGRRRTPGKTSADDIFDWMKQNKIGLGEALNVMFTIGTYKENRRQGRSIVSSAARAAGSFAMGEMFGFWGNVGIQLAVAAPKLAVAGAKALYKENRKMNAAANNQVFGNATFQDTQQLATMRQSGMEMAKMAQYNLQQTLMGNEASFLHR